MGTTALRQLLKSFCYNLPWNYAVLWKLRLEGQMILCWEDGYCDHLRPRGPVELISEDIYNIGSNELYSSCSETIAGDGGSERYPIGQVVANMSNLQYALGEGVVGEVAKTGNHLWVSYNNFTTSKANSNLVAECPDEWLLQLASGVKTILLVSVLPHGVVQLGSFQMVSEDLAVLAFIKDRFIHNAGRNTSLSILNRDIQAQSSSTITSGLIDSLDELSASTISQRKPEDSDTVDSVIPSEILLSISDPIVPLVARLDALRGFVKDLSGTFESDNENKNGVSLTGLHEVFNSHSHSGPVDHMEMIDNKLFGSSCLEGELGVFLQCNKYDVEPLEEFGGGATSYPASMELPFYDGISSDTGRFSGSFLNFPKDCELHKALGPAFQKHTAEYLLESHLSVDNIPNKSLNRKRDLTDGIEHTSSAKGNNAEYLLEAVVASVCKCTYDTSDICSGVNSSLTSLENFATLSPPPRKYEESALAGENSIPWSNATSASHAGCNNESAPTPASFKSTLETFIDRDLLEKGCSMQPRKGMKPSTERKRRTKPDDNQKPRPRDRQLIQDRLKELRELVPNGVKCSIDGLLGRTIEHMLYLKSVTNQAEKLDHWVHHKLAACSVSKSSGTKDTQNGTTWAFEVGNELLVCPIVVEDLPYQGHVLIEMLCNEPSLFLEIAQVIRSSKLTILKGITESRSCNTWAHFIVETSKGFHRTEIFWPLMHLLQRKRNPISSKI